MMKRNTLSIILALIGLTQAGANEYVYMPFVREGVKWVYYYVNEDGFYPADPVLGKGKVYMNLEFKGDTVINGLTYKAMHKYHGNAINAQNDTVPIYMREKDKIVYAIVPDGKVYLDCPIGNSFSPGIYDCIREGKEFILYNFNDPVAYWDHLVNQSGYNDQYQHSYTDTISLGTHLAKQYVGNLSGGDFRIIEGLGIDAFSSYTLYFFMVLPTGGGTYYSLSHVVEDGEIVYKGQKFDESILENKRGDVNGDGELNISDVTILIDILLNQ